jgi:ribonuclease T2
VLSTSQTAVALAMIGMDMLASPSLKSSPRPGTGGSGGPEEFPLSGNSVVIYASRHKKESPEMRPCLLILLALLLAAPLRAERAGAFDYYVLSLSWSPTWCALEGDARGAPQCDRAHGWMLHGLWPQYTRGWPDFCQSPHRPPPRALTASMADIMGSQGLAWHQWKKHGTCSGLPAPEYFALARRAYEGVNRPEVFRKLDRPVRLSAQVVEAAFLKANPGWTADMLTITCRAGRIEEARLCLSTSLHPVPCGRDVIRDCRLEDALFDPVR